VEVTTGWLEVIMLIILTPAQGLMLGFLGEEAVPFSFSGGVDCFMGRDLKCLSAGGEMTETWWPAFLMFAVGAASTLNDLAYLLLTLYGSAMYMTVANGLSASVVSLATTLHFMGHYRESFSVFTLLSCITCTLGMVVWAETEQNATLQERDYSQLEEVRVCPEPQTGTTSSLPV